MKAFAQASSGVQASSSDAGSSSESPRTGAPARVLFFVPFGWWTVHNQVDAVLAAALRLRGADICIARCDGIYPVCDVLAWSGPLAKEECNSCAAHGMEFFKSMDLPVRQMRSYLTPEDFTAIARWAEEAPVSSYATAEWNGLPIGKWVTSSVFSYFRITHRGLARPEVQAVHRSFLETGALTWLALSRMLEDYRPTRCVIFNGRMAAFRVAQELAKQRGVPFLTHERGAIDESFIFFENENCLAPQPLYECVDRWKDVPLTRAECLHVKDYLTNREHGRGMNYPSYYSYNTEHAAVRHALRIPPHAEVLLALTSSEFELAESDHYRGVCDQLELIDRLIEVFRHRDEFLVVRHHPHIAGTKKVSADLHFLTRAYRQASTAPPNVRIIMPSEALSSYALFWNVDACLSFLSSTGLEALARGIPTASLPESIYRQTMPLLIEETSAEGLNALVNDLFRKKDLFGLPQLRQVYRFLSAYIHKLPRRFKTFGIKNHFEPDLRFGTVKGLAPGQDEELDGLCEHLLSGASLWPNPTSQDQERGDAEEDVFLRDEMAKLLEQRARVRRQGARFREWRLNPTVAILRVAGTGESAPPNFIAWTARHFRRRQLQSYESHVAAAAGHPEVIRAIISGLMTVREDYALITLDSVWHDESLISSAVDQLLDDATLAVDGVLFGAWLASADNGITGEIFTERVPAATYEQAVALLPDLREPQSLLPFGLFRKNKLLPILEEISKLPDAETASRRLFTALRGNSFYNSLLPMLALTQPMTVTDPRC